MSASAIAPAAPLRASQDQIRVMVVDDAVVVRRLVTSWLEKESDIAVTVVCRDGRAAVDAIEKADPHVVILDVEMPQMDGLAALPQLLKRKPGVAVIMASTLTTRNAEVSLKALSLGARDYLPKPEGTQGVVNAEDFRRELLMKVRSLGARVRAREERTPPRAAAAARSVAPPAALRRVQPGTPRLLAIGSSTGGPQALMQVLGAAGAAFARVPIVIAQHMPATFTAIMATHIARASGLRAKEGEAGEILAPGTIYVAPGGKHMLLVRSGCQVAIRLDDGPPVNFCRPAVDPLFQSAAALYPGAVLGLVLTGMGHDGAEGARAIADAGGNVIAQDEATSVVWGMPGACVQAGAACAVLPLDQIQNRLAKFLQGNRS
jgi:two-component system chemotaxis response regulator CheB